MVNNTDITIKELADKLGISKQAVRRYFDQLPSRLVPTKKNGAYQINIEAQRFIADKVSRVDTNIDTKLDTNKNDIDIKPDTYVDTRENKELQLLQTKFIDAKDEQINFLIEQVEKMHTLLDQQQQLTLQSNKQIEKLQLQLDLKDNPDSNTEEGDNTTDKDAIAMQQQLDHLKSELEQKTKENEQLKETVAPLPKKGFWQRLFQS